MLSEQTNVGEYFELAEIASIYSGGTPSKSEPAYWVGSLPWLSAKDLKSFRVSGSIDRVSECAVGRGTRAVEAGAILVLVRGMQLFKSIPVALTTTRVTFNQDVKAIVAGSSVDSTFLAYAIVARVAELSIGVSTAGHGTGRLATETLETLPIWLPPLVEQRRIAAVLDAWDTAIAVSERLVEKHVLMRESLERSLIGDGDRRRLNDLADVVFSGVDKRIVEGETTVRLCNYMDVLNNRRLTNALPYSVGSATPLERQRFQLQRDDVVFTKDSETAGEIAEPSCVVEDLDNVVCGYHLAIARPRKGVSGAFLAHAIRSPKLRQQFVTRANGAIRFGLTLEAMDQVELPVPAYARQLLVADALDTADAEAIGQGKLIEQLRYQKRALMQLLLTGKLRVPKSVDRLIPPASPDLDAAA